MEKPEVLEIEYVETDKVFCKGTDEKLGHPKIYLKIDIDKKQVICPYCSKKFIMR